MTKRLSLALLMLSTLILTGCSPATEKGDVGIQLFMYNWESVANECEQSLGPSGISWVLVSPPQDHLDDAPWWVHYQPVSYDLNSRLGTKQQFTNMVQTCNAAGVDVIVDAVINHMAGRLAGFGWSGQSFEKYQYEQLYSEEDFHRCALTDSGQIENYFDRDQVQTCELLGLSDLDTGSARVQERIVAYLSSLLELGVAGFRIDAAKHISSSDLEQILGQLPEQTIVLHEVIRGGGEPINPIEYLATGKAWEFWFPQMVKDSLLTKWAPELPEASEPEDLLPSENAISFISNHDTERNGKSLALHQDPKLFELATLYMLAENYGAPMLYSGYNFDSYDSPPPLNPDGTVADVNCQTDYTQVEFGGWYCQHRTFPVTAMLSWRNETSGKEITKRYWSESVTAWSKQDSGFFALNVTDQAIELELETDLPAGTYCNDLVVDCQKFSVSNQGLISLRLPALSAIALSR